jgi:hypothetical protein
MENGTPVVADAEVVEVPVTKDAVQTSLDAILAQRTDFKNQLEQVKKEMVQHQQAFDNLKTKGIKLEGAIESLDILQNSLKK